MNVYRLVADMSHLFAIFFLLFKICRTRSCAGISGKSQLLLLMVFLARYLDLFTTFISYYNTFMKLVFIGSTGLTVLLIFVIYKSTYKSEHDTFHAAYLVLSAAGLAFYINHEFSFLEVMWTFSIYLEAVAILPQFFMIRKTGEMEMFTYHYLFALGLYRAFYIFNWVYRYSYEGFFDGIAFSAGFVQTALYCYFLYTKEFLKRQANAYFRLYSEEKEAKENTETAKGGEQLLVLAFGDEVEDKVRVAVSELDSVTVPDQSDPQDNETAQLNTAGSTEAEGTGCGTTETVPISVVGEPSVGEDVKDYAGEVLLPQPQ
ncbi:ER lumen protein-retaining receptor 2-like [Babylonia areolata]|uniref:ER lumen protein-retaining receptor 2-like n=1 Tax=Babylonia areolata TaxID=304850 RepID=UPI003FD0D4E5